MMYPRLKLLHKLLSDKWAIFISIDDNEQSNLKLLCDEIFWSSNFITNIVIENDSRARPYNSIAITHEYLLIYQKSWNFTANILEDPEKKFKYYDDEWWFDLYELRNRNSDFNIDNRPNLYYPFYLNPKNKDSNDLYEIDLNGHEWWIEVYPKESQWIKTVWRRWKERAYNWLNKIIFWKKASEWWQIVKKYRESTYSLNSVWTDWKFSSDRWTLTLKSYFNNKRIFAFPKPIELVQQCLSLASKKNSVILDSFAWSWTTAHAVLDLNKQDWGNRKFILVELWDYAENITAERVKRVINWYGEWDKKVEWIWWGFDFYELWEPLFKDRETLNEKVGEETLRNYIRYSETKEEIQPRDPSNKYFLWTNFDTDYYFYYEKERITELNYDFLAKIKREKNHGLIIYADICSLSEDFLKKHTIIFKKIPRDISQF
jgi:adenine-specific DNA-methyltransferase